jgi:uncharacterized protein (TIGR02453 family)
MGKAYFDSELFQFYKQIKRNNRRPWFLKNRERYEEAVRQPCLRFITDFGFRLKEISPWMVADAKPNGGSLMRIYRDVRFSPDKSPYKTWVGMNFPHAGATDEVHGAGYYLHLDAGGSFLGAGAWHPDRRSLAKIRDAISWKPDEWKKAKRGLSLAGESLTRAPRGYREAHPLIEDLKRVDFIASFEFSDRQVCGPRFLADVTAAANNLAPLVGFLARAEGLQF